MEIPIDSIYIVIKNNPFVKYLIAITFAYILFFITKKVVLKTISKIFEKTSTTLDFSCSGKEENNVVLAGSLKVIKKISPMKITNSPIITGIDL